MSKSTKPNALDQPAAVAKSPRPDMKGNGEKSSDKSSVKSSVQNSHKNSDKAPEKGGSEKPEKTATEKRPGASRFRGDVPAFNPSTSSSPHIYPPDMRQYHPQSQQPLYPQSPQFYSQQPLMFNGQMMQPYYPMAMGYPDYSMYQPYQYYMANPYQTQAPVPYMNNMNGMNSNSSNNRKKHSRNNHYANHNSSSHNLHSNHVNGKHTSQHHSNMSSYPATPTGAVFPDQLTNPSGSQFTSAVSSPQISSPTPNESSKASTNTPEPQVYETPNSSSTVPSRGAESTISKSHHEPSTTGATSGSTPPVTTNDNDTSNTAQTNETVSKHSTNNPQSNGSLISSPKYPVLFNITLEEYEKERKASSLYYNALIQRKLACRPSGLESLIVDSRLVQRVKNYNDGSVTQQPLIAQAANNGFKHQSHIAPANGTKAPMNWASVLSSNAKQAAASKKPPTSVPRLSENQKSGVETKVTSLTNAKLSAPQSLGLTALKILYDPSFDISTAKTFSLKPRGLTNSGNICYMNAVLQCLMFCPTFNKTFHYIADESIGNLGGKSVTPLIDATINFLTDFVNVPAAANGGSNVNSDGIVVGRPLSPEKFYMKLIESPQFQHLTWGQQEDAEEFLEYFLDGLHEEFVKAEATVSPEKFQQLSNSYGEQLDAISAGELKTRMKSASRLIRTTNKTEEKEESEDEDIGDKEWSEVGSRSQVSKKRISEVEPSPITRLFGGNFRSVLTIPRGREGNSITVDPFRCISVDISQENVSTIEDALWQFNEIESIPYKTEDGSEVVAKKQTFIDGLPEILVIQLKRFSYRNDEQASDNQPITSGTIEKVMKTVQYGLDLTVAPEILSPSIRASEMRKYSLIGAIYHHGRNAEGGHYTCDVLRQDEDWLRIDDTAVEAIHSSRVVEKPEARDKSAYILMYQRKGDTKDPSKRWC